MTSPSTRRQHRLVEQTGDGELVARLLAEAGVDVDATVDITRSNGEICNCTPLTHAADRGHLEAARLLLDAGADPGRAGGNTTTPLMAALAEGQLEVLRLLLARGVAVDGADPATGGTAFHYACGHDKAECAEALVRAGCDVCLKDKDGRTGPKRGSADRGGQAGF